MNTETGNQKPEVRISNFWLSSLSLTNFRSYDHLKLELDNSPVVITGANGAGKTNILEAISLLASGRGLRSAKLSEIDKQEKPDSAFGVFGWTVTSTINSPNGRTNVGTARETTKENNDKRIIKIDGEVRKSIGVLESVCSLIYFIPQMNHIFTDGTSVRRRFLDRLTALFHPEHPKRLAVYEKYMRERKRLLKENPDDIWLSVTEATMAEQAIAIAASRIETVQYIQKAINISDSAFPKADIDVVGSVEEEFSRMPSLQAEESFKNRLRETRKLDFFSGRTNFGIHRSDFSVFFPETGQKAELCSTGEQKAMLISIILGAARAKAQWFGASPIVLLDEIVAHLDDERRENLFQQIQGFGIQAWMTATSPSFFENSAKNMQFFAVKDSQIC